MSDQFCTLQKWCKRPNHHQGPCAKRATRKDVEKLLNDLVEGDTAPPPRYS